jgi:hypothetical protein
MTEPAAGRFSFRAVRPADSGLLWEATPELVALRLFDQGELGPSRYLSLTPLPARAAGSLAMVRTYGSPDGATASRGLFLTAQTRAEGASEAAVEEAERWYHEVHIPDLLGVDGVTGCWWFDGGPTIRVYWLEDDPVVFHADLAAKTPGMAMIDLRGAYRTLLVGSFRRVVDENGPSTFVNQR